ncbi:putative protein of unknown function DUF330 [Alkalidesulfovibrio alkalitolerans DSM 16529]|jgi:cholesterol transport system auxiliary component|uniref:ABC-type transport auxiliary lipoprotein component domain-containing protein n=1 Tax=Alkalidesulfovibrio alkalitolerans DSM 16529 TaxID=1121439 RepID=S7T8M5_9BACT|nr:ABC-type transport auxiliary lipoprotein family protein [Alkalidesulfovibrio alkalitolerans]EPR32835.1 putative protein of unknown function DUF330 [Alkalidesulfovibrio alkalitolerans DSM 16529]
MTRLLKLVLVLALGFVLSACALPKPGDPPRLFSLTPKTNFNHPTEKLDLQLAIAEPHAGRALQTDRIALRPAPLEFRYVKDARWAGTAPDMIQTLLMESFENSRALRAVDRETNIPRSDYLLLVDLREFQADDFGENAPRANVRLTLKLVRLPEARIVASEGFGAEVAATRRGSLLDLVEAFDTALGKVLKRGVTWAIERMAADDAN